MQMTDADLIAHFQRAFGLPAQHRELAILRDDLATPGSYYWIIFRGGLPYLEIDLAVPPELIEEAIALDERFVPHRDGEYEHRGWRALCLRGLSASHTQGARTYGYASDLAAPYRWCDEVAERAPQTQRWCAARFAGATLFRTRYMALDPGGYVAPHTDWKLPSMIGLNVVLNMPDGCRFTLGDGVLPMRTGAAFLLDLSHVHHVVNESRQTRYHMILHGLFGSCSSLRDATERAYARTLGSARMREPVGAVFVVE